MVQSYALTAEYEFTPEEKGFYLENYLTEEKDRDDSRFKELNDNISCLPQVSIGGAKCDSLHDRANALKTALG
ncbi:MAG: alpha/beta hydrolase fold domain-containing protein [Arenicellales bacterium]|nr:alpha/beta hydrolase fold domain-containing protein [Arenicellales bacterium]